MAEHCAQDFSQFVNFIVVLYVTFGTLSGGYDDANENGT